MQTLHMPAIEGFGLIQAGVLLIKLFSPTTID